MSNNIFLSDGKMADDRKTNNNFYKATDLFGETKIVFKQGKRKKANIPFEYDDFKIRTKMSNNIFLSNGKAS